MTTRVAVTGMAGLTSLGHDYDTVIGAMNSGRSGIRFMEEWAEYEGLNTNLGGPIADFVLPDHYPRKKVRSMGRVAKLAVVASERALGSAGLLGADVVSNGDCGVAYGSSSGANKNVKSDVVTRSKPRAPVPVPSDPSTEPSPKRAS